MITQIYNARIISNGNLLPDTVITFDESGILAIGDTAIPPDCRIDACSAYVSAGFIDLHVHGGGGADVMDGGTEAICQAAEMHLNHGTTSIMPTSLACSTEVLLQFLTDLRQVMDENKTEARILGAHLEGPYFSHAQSGAQNPDYIVPPPKEEYERILAHGKGVIKRWSFAPELEGAVDFCRTLVENGVIPAIAHSNATLDEVSRVYELGCKLVVHLYSGMSTISRMGGFRRLGVVESAYYYDDISAEVIADGKHLPPELLKLIIKLKGYDRICLITDAMRGAGMPEGLSYLGRKEEAVHCVIEDGVAKTMDRSGFAGSVATTDRLVRTMVKLAGVDVPHAVYMMTVTPAKILGLNYIGDIAVGKAADILVFDEDIQISKVFVAGKQVR